MNIWVSWFHVYPSLFTPELAPFWPCSLLRDLPPKDLNSTRCFRIFWVTYVIFQSLIYVMRVVVPWLHSKSLLHTHPAIWSYRPILHFDKPSFHFSLKQLLDGHPEFPVLSHTPVHQFPGNLFWGKAAKDAIKLWSSFKRALDGQQKNKVLMTQSCLLPLFIHVFFFPQIFLFF